MSLKKAIMSNSGVETNYWKVTRVNQDSISDTVQITLAGYINQTAKEDGKTPEMVKNYTVSNGDFLSYMSITELNKVDNNGFKGSYKYIKKHKVKTTVEEEEVDVDSEFADALDV